MRTLDTLRRGKLFVPLLAVGANSVPVTTTSFPLKLFRLVSLS
jgi:hypothetical protein